VPDRLLVGPSHHHDGAGDLQHGAQSAGEEGVVTDTQKRLGKPHAARLASREQNPVDGGPRHAGRFSQADGLRRPSFTPRLPLSCARERRSRTISAIIDTAISSGVSAAMSMPRGAWTWSSSSWETPLYAILSRVALTRRRDPIIPINAPRECCRAVRTTSSSKEWPRVTETR